MPWPTNRQADTQADTQAGTHITVQPKHMIIRNLAEFVLVCWTQDTGQLLCTRILVFRTRVEGTERGGCTHLAPLCTRHVCLIAVLNGKVPLEVLLFSKHHKLALQAGGVWAGVVV